MTNDEKERDAAIMNAYQVGIADDYASFQEVAVLVWNASRKHRDLQIADELDSLVSYNVETGRYEVEDTVGQYIDGLREGTK